MEKPSYLVAEKAGCIGCGLFGGLTTMISYPCVVWYVAAIV